MEWDDEVYLSWGRRAPSCCRPSDETTTLGGRAQRWLQRAVALPYVWLLLFFLTPFLIILKISVAEPLVAQPPFTPLFEWGQRGIEGIGLTFENYAFLFQDGYYGIIYLSSLKMAAIGTLLCLLIGYPMAYYIARQPARRRGAVAGGDPALLDFFPAARLCVDRSAQQPRRHQRRSPLPWRDRRAAHHALQRFRGLPRDRLFLSALHDPAALREPRTARY